MLFSRLGLYLPTSIPLPSKANLTDRLDTVFSSFINIVQQSHNSVPVALLGEHHLLLEMLTVLLHSLQICSCKPLTFCNCTHSAQTRRAFSSKFKRVHLWTYNIQTLSFHNDPTDIIVYHHSVTTRRMLLSFDIIPSKQGENHPRHRTWSFRVQTIYGHGLTATSKFSRNWSVHTMLHSQSSGMLSEQFQREAVLFREWSDVVCQDCHSYYMSI